jgi:hypothetical protein
MGPKRKADAVVVDDEPSDSKAVKKAASTTANSCDGVVRIEHCK